MHSSVHNCFSLFIAADLLAMLSMIYPTLDPCLPKTYLGRLWRRTAPLSALSYLEGLAEMLFMWPMGQSVKLMLHVTLPRALH